MSKFCKNYLQSINIISFYFQIYYLQRDLKNILKITYLLVKFHHLYQVLMFSLNNIQDEIKKQILDTFCVEYRLLILYQGNF